MAFFRVGSWLKTRFSGADPKQGRKRPAAAIRQTGPSFGKQWMHWDPGSLAAGAIGYVVCGWGQHLTRHFMEFAQHREVGKIGTLSHQDANAPGGGADKEIGKKRTGPGTIAGTAKGRLVRLYAEAQPEAVTYSRHAGGMRQDARRQLVLHHLPNGFGL